MWAKAIRWSMVLVIAGACGCAEMRHRMGLLDSEPPAPSPSPPPAHYGERVLADFHEALGLAQRLQFGDAEAKLSHLLPIFQTAGDETHAAEAMFWLGYCNEKQGRPDRASTYYQRVRSEHPDSRAAAAAGQRLAILRSP